MTCTSCNATLVKNAKFCQECGAKVEEHPQIQSHIKAGKVSGTVTNVIVDDLASVSGMNINSHTDIDTVEEGGVVTGAVFGSGKGVHVGPKYDGDHREVNTGGGTYIEKMEGDNVQGDKFVGNTYSIGGDVRDSNVIIGDGNSIQVNTNSLDLSDAFKSIYALIEHRASEPAFDDEFVEDVVQHIQTEAEKGDNANPKRIKSWLKMLADVAPDIVKSIVKILTNPVTGVASAVVAGLK